MSSEPGGLIIEGFLEEVSLQSKFGKGEMADRRREAIPGQGCVLCTIQGRPLVEGSRFQRGDPLFLTHRVLFLQESRANF